MDIRHTSGVWDQDFFIGIPLSAIFGLLEMHASMRLLVKLP